ncbi:acetyl-CoA C-acyltransferase [Lactobacillus helveticus]|uniref:acetyl-CoA C-acyltransferase n=1 Tax=Lactobacillus helveticus TaxID=1587 RepID=UPI001561C43B|nr:acetyl-CoA C-acyltransferase [Lactobacillus helveticus]NRN89955.1 Acetyl-CoA acetyltransferase [Lactobacillus helveticus]NRO45627.1 Acetyl-CoA acetyltransferase [Lactobacillus helveticus]NRO55325.1 Acetyl-CoA acetyltransferase [Lactobacillus helveticus]
MNFNHSIGIVAANRLPIGKINGVYQKVTPEELYQNLIQQQFENLSQLKQTDIEQVILGNVSNLGGNLARRCALQAGFKSTIPAQTIDCQCGSSLAAIIAAANLISVHDASLVCTGGVESTSTANTVLDANTQQPIKRFKMAPAGFKDLDMGIIADLTAKRMNISRKVQDQYALTSHRKAAQASLTGSLKPEMIPFQTSKLTVVQDQTVRFNSSLAALSKLKPAFSKSGTATAGNSCPINDGASSVILADTTLPLKFQGFYLGQTTIALDPEKFLFGPIKATDRLLQKFSLQLSEIGAIELNEAFAVQAILFKNYFNLTDAKLNAFGGALAFGHPYGATGGILITRLLNRINRMPRPALGIATLCVAGGMGISVLVGNKWWQN